MGLIMKEIIKSWVIAIKKFLPRLIGTRPDRR